MKTSHILHVSVATMLFLMMTGCSSTSSQQGSSSQNSPPSAQITSQEENLRLAMRKLWEEHITWTRLVIVDIANALPSEGADTQRLLKNATDLADAMKGYYPSDASDSVGSLIKDHLTIAATLVHAAKSGDTAAASTAETQWYANADALAAALSGANPAWPQADVKAMLYDHLKLTKQEAVAAITQDSAGSIAAYDQIHVQALMMADTLTDGIIKQFPEKFGQ